MSDPDSERRHFLQSIGALGAGAFLTAGGDAAQIRPAQALEGVFDLGDFALKELTSAEEARIAALVKKAVS